VERCTASGIDRNVNSCVRYASVFKRTEKKTLKPIPHTFKKRRHEEKLQIYLRQISREIPNIFNRKNDETFQN
jgi:hypothetical protein